MLGQVGAAELVPQAPGDVQHLPGDATEGHGDLVHQLPVPREVIVGGTAQVRPVAPADRSGGRSHCHLTSPGVPIPELSALCHPPQAAPGGFSCLFLPGFGSMTWQPHALHGTRLETAFLGGKVGGLGFFILYTLSPASLEVPHRLDAKIGFRCPAQSPAASWSSSATPTAPSQQDAK